MEAAFNDALKTMWTAGLYPQGIELTVPLELYKQFCSFTDTRMSEDGQELIYNSDFGEININIKVPDGR